jgi:hypothetical protein
MATAPVFESDSLPWEINQAPHRWDVTKPEIYLEDRWHPIFKEMREKAPINKITGSDSSMSRHCPTSIPRRSNTAALR